MPDTLPNQKVTLSVKVLLGIIFSTITICITILSAVNNLRQDVNEKIGQQESNTRLMELKFDYLKLELENLKINIEKNREELRNQKR
jgi:hypothetical protein